MMRSLKLGIGWLDVVKFESRVTQALEIQEDIKQQDIVDGARKAGRKRRYIMLGLTTISKAFSLAVILVNLCVVCNLQAVGWLLAFPPVFLRLLLDST